MKELIGMYKNGNYTVKILSDGTKIRETEEDDFIPAFAENCDCTITKKCDGGCAFCYAGCTQNGKHAELLNWKFLDSLHPYTELALNGNDLSHPQLDEFLLILKDKKVFANMTVNQKHFEQHYNRLMNWSKNGLIHGVGVSLVNPTDEFISKVKAFPNTVIHTIAGILTKENIDKLGNNNLKVLMLGYKTTNRGQNYLDSHNDEVNNNIAWLRDNLQDVLPKFNVVSFDNMAIEQLNVKRLLTDEEWEEFFMGQEAEFTFYLDLVDGTYAMNSIQDLENHRPIGDLSIDEMFENIRLRK